MFRERLRSALTVLGPAVLVAVLCGSLSLEAHGMDGDASFSAAERKLSGDDSDSRFLKVSHEVPEFGGSYIDRGSLYIWLTRPTDELRDQARAELVSVGGTDFDADEVVALKAEYSFEQLYRWHNDAVDVLSIDGVVLTDIDERINRLVIEVEDPRKQEGQVEAELSESGVPRAAVNIVKGSPIQFAQTDNRRLLAAAVAAVVLLVAVVVLLVRRRSRRQGVRSQSITSESEQPSRT